MTKNPIINAVAALGYIVIVSSLMFYGPEKVHTEDTVIIPIAMLSLFSLSAAIMAYLFFYTPLQLFLDGKKKESLDLFVKTVGVFAALTIIAFILLLSGKI